MGYKVVQAFADSKDNGYVYRTGGTYPRQGVEPDPMRIAELASTANALGFPLIAESNKESSKPKTAEKPAKAKSTKTKG